MNRAEKAEFAADLKKRFSRSTVAIFADYKGLSATQADELRRSLRPQNVEVKVLKNNIARLATQSGELGVEAKDLLDSVVGPTLVAFTYGDPAALAKVIHKFAQTNEALKIKDSLMSGQKRINAQDVEVLANLPSKDVLIAQLLGTMNAPIQSFVSVLAAVPRSLVTVLDAIEKKKADSPPPA